MKLGHIILTLTLLLSGCGIFNTTYTCTLYYYPHLDSTYTISGGTVTIDDADDEVDAKGQCEAMFSDYEYCTCKAE